MGSQVLQVLRQGVWASLTGGCFLDPQQSAFTNCFHLYAWLFLLGLPLVLYTALPPSAGVGALYCGLVGAFFAAVKAVNYRLHAAFDGGRGGGDPQSRAEGGAAALLNPPGAAPGEPRPGTPGGGLELAVLGGPSLLPPPPWSPQPSLCGFNQLSELLPQLEHPAGPWDVQQLLRAWGSSGVLPRGALSRDPPGGTAPQEEEDEEDEAGGGPASSPLLTSPSPTHP